MIFIFYTKISMGLEIDFVTQKCDTGFKCHKIKNIGMLVGQYKDKDELINLIDSIKFSIGVEKYRLNIKKKSLIFYYTPFRLIKDVKISLNKHRYEPTFTFPFIKDEVFDKNDLENGKKTIKKELIAEGFVNPIVKINVIDEQKTVMVKVNILTDGEQVLNSIKINSRLEKIKKKFRTELSAFEGKIYSEQKVKNKIEEIRRTLVTRGYYFIEISKAKVLKKNRVNIIINIKNLERQFFDIRGLSLKHKVYLKELIRKNATVYKRFLTKEKIEQLVGQYLEDVGYLDYKTQVEQIKYKEGSMSKLMRIVVSSKNFTKVRRINFKGNSLFSNKKLLQIFRKHSSQLANNSYFDKKYYLNFLKILKKEYAKNGYVNSRLAMPKVYSVNGKKLVDLTFKIKEGERARLNTFFIQGIDKRESKNIIKNIFKLSKGDTFDPIRFEENLRNFYLYMQNEGYYFFKILNIKSQNFLKYSNKNSLVDINIEVNKTSKVRLGNLKIFGNTKTRNKLIFRTLKLKMGQILIKNKVSQLKSKLLSLGIFSSVDIIVLSPQDEYADLVIYVKERDFGLVELAPGIRSDIGPKISSTISYSNFDGMNKKIRLKTQVNRRFDLSTLADRENSDKDMLEYEAELSYIENNVLNSDINFSASLSELRNRFFLFDADIRKLSYTATSDITDWFQVSLTQQLETIFQYNADDEQLKGKFQIGSITPGVTFDFRDTRVNTQRGAYFNLSVERASPTFLSQYDDDIRIDYYKVISRNYFYMPHKYGVFALSITGGMQENLARNQFNSSGEEIGYIPNIKVFRLSGVDIVRGFEDDEINRLISNEDIREVYVNSKAYMFNFKFEPRFQINDSMVAGVFYDAGRVFVDKMNLDKLRSSVGVTFKYVTPVGTLDFDYGIKLLRKKDSGGKLDTPGRLHVSIGFF
jgi:outer membrane protein insertion porin family